MAEVGVAVRRIQRAPASGRTDFVAGYGVMIGLGIGIGGGVASEPDLVIVLAPLALVMALLLVVAANGDRIGIRADEGSLHLETGVTRSSAVYADVERVVVSVNAGRVFVKAHGAWRYVRVAVAGEQLAKPAVLRGELERILEATPLSGRVEFGKFGTIPPSSLAKLLSTDLARWPLTYVAPRPATWWRALLGLGVLVAVALATRAVSGGW